MAQHRRNVNSGDIYCEDFCLFCSLLFPIHAQRYAITSPTINAMVIELRRARMPMIQVMARESVLKLYRAISIPTNTSRAPRTPIAMMERTCGEEKKRARKRKIKPA